MKELDAQFFQRVVASAGHVGVLMGGTTAEREVSLNSGNAVARALNEAGIKVTTIDWDGSLESLTKATDIDRFFVALHGRGGEDGQVQAALELLGREYTGSGVAACALAMDKVRSKWTWAGAGLPTPKFEVVAEHEPGDAEHLLQSLGLPMFIKPAREGSSIGISKVDSGEQIADAIKQAKQFDGLVLAEQFVAGGEYTISIVAGKALPTIKLETPRGFYDYQAKYLADDTNYLCPCGLDRDAEVSAEQLALRAFETLGGRGWGRIDLMRDGDGKMWLIEMNTVPGMTDHSLVPMSGLAAGWSFQQLVLVILGSSMSVEALS